MSDVRTVTPPAPLFAAADFGAAFLALLPNGPVWPRDADAVLARTAGALAPTYERMTMRAAQLLQEAPAGGLVEVLPEWEATLGLPDPCLGPSPTIAQRQRGVRAAVAAKGGQSIPYYTMVAAALGYPITVVEYASARTDVLAADDPVYGPDWDYAWQVTLPSTVVVEFAADVSFADDPLASWGSHEAECTIRRIAPAHTVLSFAYSGGASGAALGEFVLDRDVLT